MLGKELEKRIIEIIQNLDSKGQFTGIEAIDEITGLYLLASMVSQHSIKIYSLTQEEEELRNIIEILSRYPPYEPIPLGFVHGKKNVILRGSRVWLIKPKDFRPLGLFKQLKVKFSSASELIIRCDFPPDIISSGIIIQDLEPIDILEFRRGSIIMYIHLKDRYHYFFIKYGSEKLKRLIDEGKDERLIKDQYRKETGKRYDPLNLTYVWYCRLGIGISTDPWDTKCPFQRLCIIGKARGGCNGRRYWSWRRRIFPKIYLVRQGFVKGEEKLLYKLDPLVKIHSIHNAQVTVLSPYASTQIGEIIFRPINIEFERPITYVLRNSNAIEIEFNAETIKNILKTILMRDINPVSYMSIIPKIYDVLMTKYFLYKYSNQGRNLIEILGLSKDKLLNKYGKFKKRIRLEDLTKFSYHVLLHTITHTIYELVLKDFELSEEHILYSYDVNSAKVYIIENTRYGCLDIITQFRMKYSDIHSFREKYLEFVKNVIDIHENEIKEFANELKNEEKTFIQKMPKFKNVLKELKRYYNELLKHGLVLDAVQFKIHIYESNYVADLAKRFKISMKDIEDYLDHLILLTIKLYCLDGCTSCVQLEKYCSELLAQPLITSRNLLREFIKVYLEEHDIIADHTLPESLLRKSQRIIVAATPYIDGHYIDLLEKKANSDVNIIIITNKDTADSIRKYKLLKNIVIRETEHRMHEKYYIIDDICLKTTWNMQLTKSTNAYILCTSKETIEHIKSLFKQQYKIQVP